MTDPPTDPANIVQIPDGAMLQRLMGQINGNPGPRQVPGRTIPVPNSVSAELQTAIAMPYRNSEWLLNPPDAQGWKDARRQRAASWSYFTYTHALRLTSDGFPIPRIN